MNSFIAKLYISPKNNDCSPSQVFLESSFASPFSPLFPFPSKSNPTIPLTL